MPIVPRVDRFALSQKWAGSVAKSLQPLIHRAVAASPVRNTLDGVWFGEPLHPALTDVPIGSWAAALLLDGAAAVTSDEVLAAAADRVLAVGTLAALPAAATGLSDLRDLIGQSRQIAMVHAMLTLVGLSLTSASLAQRRAGRRGLAFGLSASGFAVTSCAAQLGGKLTFGLGIRVNRTMGQHLDGSFVPVLADAELDGEQLRKVELDCTPVLLARSSSGEVCALANTCTHLGAPLHEGTRDGDTVTCPWHGSKFDLRTGAVLQGPAVFAQPRLAARVQDGKIEVAPPDGEWVELPEIDTP